MLKHVSYRASNTSLTRPFGSCRASSTLPQSSASIERHGESPNKCNSLPPASAPNSPQISNYGRHARHHSIIPTADKFMPTEEEFGNISPRKDETKKSLEKSLDRTTESSASSIFSESGHNTSTDSAVCMKRTSTLNGSTFSEDSLSLKPDDPLSQHKKNLRCLDSIKSELGDLPDGADTISLSSSMGTLSRNELRASTVSLCNSTNPANKVPVRIHLRQLRPDIEYKTLKLDAETTCRQLIEHLLHKLRLKHRDPNLFVVVLEAAVKGPAGSAPIKRKFVLDDSARPVELQQCRPRGEANFSISTRRGGVLRVKDSVLAPGSQYKSVLVSYDTNVVEVIKLLLRCNNRSDDWRMFTLHELCSEPYGDRMLGDRDKPLYVQNNWPKDVKHNYTLILRRHLTQGLIESGETWRNLSLDDCILDQDVELDEHNSTCSSITTNSSNSSRSRSSISSSTASVLSLASLSSNSSSRCSFSSGSSSGVSSGSSSSSYSPDETPDKNRKTNSNPKRMLPLTPNSVKSYPRIDVEENVQSYFTMPSDDEYDKKTPVKGSPDKDQNLKNRPPQPLPRKALNFPASSPVYVNSADIKITMPQNTKTSFRKSFSAIYSPNNKARGPSAQSWQTRSRTARIRSATISSIEHMANFALHSRSKSSDSKHNTSTLTLTSQPSTPSTPTSSNSMFTFSKPSLSKSQSTSSINNLNTSKFLIDHPVIVPSSTKLRPLSLAPNSCMVFPSRPSSTHSSLSSSQSTSTLRASSSSICLLPSTPVREGTNSSFISSTSSMVSPPSLMLESSQYSSSSQSMSPSSLQISSPTKSPEPKETGNNIEPKCTGIRIISMTRKSDVSQIKSFNQKLCHQESNPKKMSDERGHHHQLNCPSSCQYDNCFYI